MEYIEEGIFEGECPLPKKEEIRRLAHIIHWHGLDTDRANDGVPHTSSGI